MPTTFIRTSRATPLLPSHGAIVWLDRQRALVTTQDRAGALHVREFAMSDSGDGAPSRYAGIVHALLDADSIVVLGEPDARLGLERAYVSVARHPERLHEPLPRRYEAPA